MKWALFFLAEYCNIFVVSAVAVTLFLGGLVWAFVTRLGVVYFENPYTSLVLYLDRWTFPRIRLTN